MTAMIDEEAEVPEVLAAEDTTVSEAASDLSVRVERAFGPVIAGLIIDFLDLATFGPIGLLCGLVIGGAAAYWICSIYGLPKKQRWLWALIAGAYCTVPVTEFIPMALLFGAYLRFKEPRVRVPADDNMMRGNQDDREDSLETSGTP